MTLDTVYLGDAVEVVKTLPDESVNCVVTSPPYYGLRDYGVDGQLGLEETPEQYIYKLVSLFREIRRVLKRDGTVWVNLGDSYAGNCSRTSKGRAGMGAEREGVFTKGGGLASKQLMGIPWRFAFAMQEDGWYLRQDIIWHKPNPMPESVTDRCTKSHEYIFLLSKNEQYYFDHESIQEQANTQVDPRIGKRLEYDGIRKGQEGMGQRAFVSLKTKPRFGGSKYGDNADIHFSTYSGKEWNPRTKNCQEDGQVPNSMHLRREVGLPDEVYVVRNKRDVWTVNVKPNKEAHFATYPPELISPCILAGCPPNGVVLDPFMGSGTTGIVAARLSRHFVGVELNPEYQQMSLRRINNEGTTLFIDTEN